MSGKKRAENCRQLGERIAQVSFVNTSKLTNLNAEGGNIATLFDTAQLFFSYEQMLNSAFICGATGMLNLERSIFSWSGHSGLTSRR